MTPVRCAEIGEFRWATRFAAGLYSASLSRVFAPALRVTIPVAGRIPRPASRPPDAEGPAAPGLMQGRGPECSRFALGASLFVCWLAPAEGARRAAFFRPRGVFSLPRFPLTVAIPPLVCPSPRPVAAGFHKSAKRFYKASGPRQSAACGRQITGDSEGKTGRKKVPPKA